LVRPRQRRRRMPGTARARARQPSVRPDPLPGAVSGRQHADRLRDARRRRPAGRGPDDVRIRPRRRGRHAARLRRQPPSGDRQPRPPDVDPRAAGGSRRGLGAVGGGAARDPHPRLSRRGQRPAARAHLDLDSLDAHALPPLPPGPPACRAPGTPGRPPRRPGSARRTRRDRQRRRARPRRGRLRDRERRAVIPKPPFLSDLSPELEVEAFRELQPRLAEVWEALTMRDEEPHTSVVVPSLTLDQSELQKLEGASFYEERLLLLLIRLRNPRARVVYVTSQPIHPMILDYYFHLLAGIPASHARSRLTLLCAHDASPRSLTQKVLERPRLIERIRDGIQDPARAYLTVFNATPLERQLAVLLGIPMNGADPDLAHLGTKSGSRKVFREAGVALPAGVEDLRDEREVAEALVDLARERPGIRRAVVKLNDSFSGEGNAIFRYPETVDRTRVEAAL